MSVLGSQLEIDIDPEGEAVVMPRHIGNTGTGCYKLHDHRYRNTLNRNEGPVKPQGPDMIISKDGADDDIGLTQPPGSAMPPGKHTYFNPIPCKGEADSPLPVYNE